MYIQEAMQAGQELILQVTPAIWEGEHKMNTSKGGKSYWNYHTTINGNRIVVAAWDEVQKMIFDKGTVKAVAKMWNNKVTVKFSEVDSGTPTPVGATPTPVASPTPVPMPTAPKASAQNANNKEEDFLRGMIFNAVMADILPLLNSGKKLAETRYEAKIEVAITVYKHLKGMLSLTEINDEGPEAPEEEPVDMGGNEAAEVMEAKRNDIISGNKTIDVSTLPF